MALVESELRDMLPPPRKLFKDEQECHDQMLAVVNEVLQQLKADGVPIPPFPVFYRDLRRLWNVWRRYA